MNGTLFFTAWDETSGNRLWKSDGTEPGTTVVNDIRPIPGNNTEPFEVYDNNLYFVVDDLVSNRFELWKSDGTDGGTARLKDTNPSGYDDPKELTVVGDTLFFQATNGLSSGIELWKTDGTEIGTVMVKDIRPGASAGSRHRRRRRDSVRRRWRADASSALTR